MGLVPPPPSQGTAMHSTTTVSTNATTEKVITDNELTNETL